MQLGAFLIGIAHDNSSEKSFHRIGWNEVKTVKEGKRVREREGR